MSRAYYSDNKFEIQTRRLYNDLATGKRKNITQATIAKYHVKFDDDGKVIIPKEFLPSAKIIVEPTQPIDLTVKAPDEVHLVPKVMYKGPVTTKQVQDYIKSPQFNEDRKTNGEKQLSTSSITQYATGAAILIKLGLVKSKTEDIMPIISDAPRVIAALQARDITQSTLNKDLHSCYNLCKNIPMVRDQVPKSITQEYGKLLGAGKVLNTNQKYDELQAKPVYKWPDIVKNIDSTFGKDSIQSLYFHVYEEVPIRGELKRIPINPTSHEGNYLIIDKKKAVIHLKKYKTQASYGNKEYTLTPSLTKMVKASLKKEPRDMLFPIEGPLSHWLEETLDKAGYPNFPFGPQTTQPDRAKLHIGLRHTFAAYANSDLNKGAFPSGHKLASLMLHELQQSLTAYTNKQFFSEEDRMRDAPHHTPKPTRTGGAEKIRAKKKSRVTQEEEEEEEDEEDEEVIRPSRPRKAPTPNFV